MVGQGHDHAPTSHGHGHGEAHGGGHGHGHGPKFVVPDWRKYKIDGIKQLEWTRDSLAEKGLRDPWLRNEVWRYEDWPGYGRSMISILTRGLKYAAAAMVVTIAVDQILGISRSKQHHGEHHGEEHGEHHSSH